MQMAAKIGTLRIPWSLFLTLTKYKLKVVGLKLNLAKNVFAFYFRTILPEWRASENMKKNERD